MAQPVEVHVGGRTYRVVASAEEGAVQRLASLVDTRLRQLTGSASTLAPQALLLAAISLAHDLEHEREQRRRIEQRSREQLRAVLARIDAAIEESARIERECEPPTPPDDYQPSLPTR